MINNEITINGIFYVKKDSIPEFRPADKFDDMEYCIVQTDNNAGTHIGYVIHNEGTEATLVKARKVVNMQGAEDYSDLAVHGTTEPDNCNLACEVDSIYLKGVKSIIPVSKKSQDTIQLVPERRGNAS